MKSTKHAREPLSLTLSPPYVLRTYSVLHFLLLRTPYSVLCIESIDIHALRTGAACAAYTAWSLSVRREYGVLGEYPRMNGEYQRRMMRLAIIIRLHHFAIFYGISYYTRRTRGGTGHKCNLYHY